MKVPVSFPLLPEPFLPAERKKRAAKRKIQEEAEAARSAAGGHSVDSTVAAGSSDRNGDRLDHVFAVPKTPSPVPVPAATEEAAAARPRRKAGLRPQKREMVAAAPSVAEPEVGRHSKQLLFDHRDADPGLYLPEPN
jgi:hypothetical protein